LTLEVEGGNAITNPFYQPPWGTEFVIEPRQAVQVRARGYLPDESPVDVTNHVSWKVHLIPSGLPTSTVSVRNGVVQAHDSASVAVVATYPSQSPRLAAHVRVLAMPAGTFVVTAWVHDAKSLRPVDNAWWRW
jgi:hypothetical protein